MSKKQSMSKGEETFFMYVGAMAIPVVFFLWLFDVGPFEDAPPSEPEYRVLTSGLYCISERDALRLGDAYDRRDSDKLSFLVDSGACRNNAPMFIPVDFLSGSFSTGVVKVAWPATQGGAAGSGFVLPSDFSYMTATELDKEWETFGPICEKHNPGDCSTGRK